ncbi:hypothetical protein J6590_034143 [Homalodisca vitripennis]|nr:hypothetical protein J6590_034143 [Homalodisca vitripennis]
MTPGLLHTTRHVVEAAPAIVTITTGGLDIVPGSHRETLGFHPLSHESSQRSPQSRRLSTDGLTLVPSRYSTTASDGEVWPEAEIVTSCRWCNTMRYATPRPLQGSRSVMGRCNVCYCRGADPGLTPC